MLARLVKYFRIARGADKSFFEYFTRENFATFETLVLCHARSGKGRFLKLLLTF